MAFEVHIQKALSARAAHFGPAAHLDMRQGFAYRGRFDLESEAQELVRLLVKTGVQNVVIIYRPETETP
jgi:hypothetical protein